jgi:hypothetical protein
MPKSDKQLPKRKLREFLNTPIKIERMFFGTSKFGPYVILFTATDAIISSGNVVLTKARELQPNLPVTVTPTEVEGKNHKYFVLA